MYRVQKDAKAASHRAESESIEDTGIAYGFSISGKQLR
jgi:hypothetical protein